MVVAAEVVAPVAKPAAVVGVAVEARAAVAVTGVVAAAVEARVVEARAAVVATVAVAGAEAAEVKEAVD